MNRKPEPFRVSRHPVALMILLALTVSAQTAQAQVYRWTDANGKVVVSDSPPPGVKAQKIGKTVSSSETTKDNADAKKAKPALDPEVEKRTRDQEQRDQSAEEARKKEIAEYCRASRFQLGDLEGGLPMYTRDSKGARVLMNTEMRAEEIAKLKSGRQQAKCD